MCMRSWMRRRVGEVSSGGIGLPPKKKLWQLLDIKESMLNEKSSWQVRARGREEGDVDPEGNRWLAYLRSQGMGLRNNGKSETGRKGQFWLVG